MVNTRKLKRFPVTDRARVTICALGILLTVGAGNAGAEVPPDIIEIPPLAVDGATEWTRTDAVATLMRGNPDLLRAQFQIRAAQPDVSGSLGLFDPNFTADLKFDRSVTPTTFADVSGSIVQQNYEWNAGFGQKFVTGTQLGVSLRNGASRSDFRTNEDTATSDFGDLLNDRDLNFQTTLALTVSQSLLRGFGKKSNLISQNVASRGVDVQTLGLLQQANAKLAELLIAYAELRYSYDQYELRSRALERTRRQFSISQARLEAGQIAPIELDLVHQRIAANLEALLIARADVGRQSRALARLVGEGDSLLLPADPLEEGATAPYVDEVCTSAVAQTPTYRIAEQQLAIANLQVRQSREQGRPTLDLSGGLTASGYDPNYATAWGEVFRLRQPSMFAGLNFQTTFRSRATRAQVEKALVAVDSAEFEIQEIRRSLCHELRESIEAARLTEARIALADYRVEIAQRASAAEEERFAQGLSTVQLGLDALESLEESENQALRVRTDAEIARLRVQTATGELARKYLAAALAEGADFSGLLPPGAEVPSVTP